MHQFELICMDLDGTLLDGKKHVSERAKSALKHASEQHIHIALISGRMPHAIQIVEDQIGISCIQASAAGTYVTQNGTCIYDQTMSVQTMIQVYEKVAQKCGVPLWIYRGTEWYVTQQDQYVDYESGVIGLRPQIADLYELQKMWEKEGHGPNKLLFGAAPDKIMQIKETLAEEQIEELDFARSADFYLEIFPKGANKGSAVAAICKVLQIDLQKTIAFGDQELDIPMLQEAEVAVAMANAPQKVKDCADHITLSNEEDGVAIAIEQYVLSSL